MGTDSKQDHEINPHILIVEDNPLDVLLLMKALKSGGFGGQPIIVDDGAPAIKLLEGVEPFEDAPKPEMIILDLNLKTVDGPEVLSYIRTSPDLSNTLVVILSSSPEEFSQTSRVRADSYLKKPSGLREFISLGDTLREIYTQHGAGKRAGARA